MIGAIRKTADLPYPCEVVWEALTEDAQLSAWLDAEVELELRPGGILHTAGREGRQGVVEEVDHARRLAFRWWPVADGPRDATIVEIELEPTARGTRLTVSERQCEAHGEGRVATPIHVDFRTRKRTVPFGFQPPRASVGRGR